MRCKVQLYVAGQIFTEEVRAVDYQEARQVALARNPNATVVSVTALMTFCIGSSFAIVNFASKGRFF